MVRLKSQEQILAQTAAFAAEQPMPHNESLSKDIGNTALRFMRGEDVVSTGVDNLGQQSIETFTPNDYRNFLRSADEETREDINFIAEKTKAYPTYRARVTEILSAAGDDKVEAIGRGRYGAAYPLEQNGQDYVIKTGGVSFTHAKAFRRGEQISNISHLVAVDLQDGISVMNRVPGERVDRMTTSERHAIPKSKISGLINKVIEMYDHGLAIDSKPSNFFYDQESGFGIIDYLPSGYYAGGEKRVRPFTKAELVINLTKTLSRPDSPMAEQPVYGSPEHAELLLAQHVNIVGILGTYLDVLEAEHPDILQEAAAGQAEINARRVRSGSIIYDTLLLPKTQEFAAFRSRLAALGLQGNNPDA